MNILKEIKAIREYLYAHEDELLEKIKEANLEAVKVPSKRYVGAYVDGDNIQLDVLTAYADDVTMRRLDGNNPYLIYSIEIDNYTAGCICDLDDGRVLETDKEIMDELDTITIWRDEIIKAYDKLDDLEEQVKCEDLER